jgi:hypothetical protein
MSNPKNGHAGPAALTPQQEEELRAYRLRWEGPFDGPSILREIRELQARINELVVKYHGGK